MNKFPLATTLLLPAVFLTTALTSWLNVWPADDPSGEISYPVNNSGYNRCNADNLVAGIKMNYCNQSACVGPSCQQKCCINNDGQCWNSCNSSNDNDCIVKEKLEQAHQYLLANKSPLGYTPATNESQLAPKTEVYRIIPGSQAIGYLNLYKTTGNRLYYKEAQGRLDYLASIIQAKPNEIWRGDSFDGFLGYAFLLGHELGCKKSYRDIGLAVADRCLNYQGELNWGMMCGLNLGQAYKLTGDKKYLKEAKAIVTRTAQHQNDDGSFPHQATPEINKERNRGYTAWLGLELFAYKKYDSNVGSLIDLNKTVNILELLTDQNGRPIYERCPAENPAACSGSCSGEATTCDQRSTFSSCLANSGCTWGGEFCSGEANSCSTFPGNTSCTLNGCLAQAPTTKYTRYYDEDKPDYETKGGAGELASSAVVFQKGGKTNAEWKALNFLFSLQNPDYSFKPKWGYPSPPGATSLWETPTVVTSDIFFTLSELLQK